MPIGRAIKIFYIQTNLVQGGVERLLIEVVDRSARSGNVCRVPASAQRRVDRYSIWVDLMEVKWGEEGKRCAAMRTCRCEKYIGSALDVERIYLERYSSLHVHIFDGGANTDQENHQGKRSHSMLGLPPSFRMGSYLARSYIPRITIEKQITHPDL